MTNSTFSKKNKNLQLIKTLLILFITFSLHLNTPNSKISCLQLIPNRHNPILIKNPDKSNSPTINIKFKFDKNSQGLEFGQFISLVFPKNIQKDLNFHLNSNNLKYYCSLSDGKISYKMTPVISPSEKESNWTFCKLTDPNNSPIKPNENKEYTFSITLSDGIKFSTNFLRSFGIFTSTSSKPERIIIDQLPYIGTAAVYDDPKIFTNKMLEVTKSALLKNYEDENKNNNNQNDSNINKQTEIFEIYPYQKFDVLLNLKSNSFLSFSDIFITFNYNHEMVSPPISVETNSLSFNDQLLEDTKALKGNLSLSSSTSYDFIILNGIQENLYPNRQFQIILKGWKAKDQFTNLLSPLELKVYYRNTYSLISYEKISTKFFNISKIPITLESDHPDGFDMFRSGVFPLRFKFTSKYDILKESYVLIRHSNAQKGKNRFNFVAATCDFSENSSKDISQNFGKRPICFPLRKDQNYPNESEQIYKGSGIFFRINSIRKNTEYYLTVWGSADNCGGDAKENFNSAISVLNTFVKFGFNLEIYNTINSNENEENRFLGSTILAESNFSQMNNKCWNTFPQLPKKFPLENNEFMPSLIPFEESQYRKTINVIDSKGSDCNKDSSDKFCALENDINLYREFYNIKLMNIITTSPKGNYFNDLTDTANNINKEHYLYGTDTIGKNSYFALVFDSPILKDKKIMEYIPSPVAYDKSEKAGNSANLLRTLPGRLELKLQKNWFDTGNSATNTSPGCYFSWGVNEADFNTKRIMKNITNPQTEFDCTKNVKNAQHNFITSFAFTSSVNGIDCAKATPNLDINVSNFPTSENNQKIKHYRIVSLWNSTGPGTKEGASSNKDQNGVQNKPADPTNTDQNATFNFPLPTEFMNEKLKNTSNNLVFGLYSSCFKWKTDNTIKSLYSSIDFQLNYLYTNDPSQNGYKSAIPHRAIRLIKLYPEGGVFQDITSSGRKILSTSIPDNTNSSTRTMKLHYSIGENSLKVGVCLIEICGDNLQATADKNSNALVIWIGFGVLLETDYEDLAANYPIAPMASKNIEIWGLQSGYFFNSNDNLFYNKFLNDSNQFNDADITKISQSYLGFNLMTYAFTGKTDNVAYIPNGQSPQFDDNKMFNSNRSSYLFLQGSVVIVNNISDGNVLTKTGGNYNNLLIPIYCPIDDSLNKAVLHRNGLPTLYMAYISMKNFNEISSVNRIYTAKVASSLYATVNNAAAVKSDSYRDNFSRTDLFHDQAKYKNFLFTLRWAPYDSKDDNTMYLYYGIVKKEYFKPDPTSNCTGHILLISTSRISIDTNTLTQNGFFTANAKDPAQSAFISNTNKKFYYLGNAFNKAFMFGLGNKMTTNSQINPTLGSIVENKNGSMVSRSGDLDQSTSFFKITGVKRPSVESLFLNGVYKSPFNEIAYFCNSAQYQTYQIWSNFITPISSIESNAFILDYNPVKFTSKTTNKFAVEFSYDVKDTEIIKNDTAGNMRAIISLPVNTNGGFSINFSVSNNALTNDSICGIETISNRGVTECGKNNQFYSCPLLRTGIKHTICCYNVSLNYDTISILTMKVNAPEEPQNFKNLKFSSKEIYSTDDNTMSWDNKQSTGIDLIAGGKSAQLAKFEYFQVIQENGFGKMKMTFNLPREISRNSIYTFQGELGNIFIPNMQTKCTVSVQQETIQNNGNISTKEIGGNIIIDTCEAPGKADPIVIKTKNIIYKCGLNFSKVLYITLSPVKIVNWKLNENSIKTFKLVMSLNNNSLTDIANNKKSFNIPSAGLLYAKNRPKYEDQWDDLCKVGKINPPIPGVFADYQFDFDFEKAKDKLVLEEPNEFTIFFPYIHYSISSNMIFCFYENKKIQCSFSDEETLNIKFDKGTKLPVGDGKKISITISGIANPSYYSDIYFACTVNNINEENGERVNLVTGTGILKDGLKISESTKFGALRILNKFEVSDKNPRNISIHKFRVGFDTAIGLTNLPITFNNTPQLIITFPREYDLGLYADNDQGFSNRFSTNIYEYINNKSNKIIHSTTIVPKKVEIRGNRAIIYFYNKSYIFEENFQFWEISIEGIKNPSETTSNTGSDTTGQFNFLLTNSDYSQVYKTFSNLNTAGTNFMFNQVDYLINMNRGIEFKFDNSKWVIDVNSMGEFNKISIKPGRFVFSTFQIKPNSSSKIQPRSINISLNDSKFKLSDDNYIISTGVFQPVKFFIGCPCSTTSGKYIINFSMKGDPNNDFFSPLVPVEVSIKEKIESSEIEFIQPQPVPPGGSTPIYFNILEPNFDKLDISFISNPDVTNDSTAKIENLEIPKALIKSGFEYEKKSKSYTTFIISNINVSTNQQFLPKEINNCFKWSSNPALKILDINLSGSPAIIDPNEDLSAAFNYYNSETDGENSTLKKNSIKFTYLPKVNPVYLYCALNCYSKQLPSDDKIKSGKFEQNELSRYFSTLISSKTNPTNIIFKDLVRGQRYKLKCIVTSTQSDVKNRTEVSQEILSLSSGSKKFVPTNPIKTQCIQYTFEEKISLEKKKILLNYCQKIFSQGNSGCIVCTDNILSMFTPGLSIPTNLKCPESKAVVIKSLRNLKVSNELENLENIENFEENFEIFDKNFEKNFNKKLKTLKFLQENNKNNTNTDKDTNPPIYLVDVKNPITFTVCPMQNPTCPTDVTGNKLYGDFLNSFKLKTKPNNIKLIEGLSNSTLNNSLIVKDDFSPNLKDLLTMNLLLIDKSGLVQWAAKYPTPLKCNWKIFEKDKGTINDAEINDCQDFIWCGKNYEVMERENSGNTNQKKLRKFEENKNYVIAFVCYNNIPDPLLISDVYIENLGMPNNPNEENNDDKNNTDTDGNKNSTDNNSTVTKGGRVMFDVFNKCFLIYMIIILLF